MTNEQRSIKAEAVAIMWGACLISWMASYILAEWGRSPWWAALALVVACAMGGACVWITGLYVADRPDDG